MSDILLVGLQLKGALGDCLRDLALELALISTMLPNKLARFCKENAIMTTDSWLNRVRNVRILRLGSRSKVSLLKKI